MTLLVSVSVSCDHCHNSEQTVSRAILNPLHMHEVSGPFYAKTAVRLYDYVGGDDGKHYCPDCVESLTLGAWLKPSANEPTEAIEEAIEWLDNM